MTDIILLREGLKLARKAATTAPLSNVLKTEAWPGSRVETDAEWDDWLKGQIATEYHPSGTCAMLPRTEGGVVNARLQVYGLSNVRVADASVFPLSLTTHVSRCFLFCHCVCVWMLMVVLVAWCPSVWPC